MSLIRINTLALPRREKGPKKITIQLFKWGQIVYRVKTVNSKMD